MRKPLLSRGPLLAGVCILSLAVLPGIGENAQRAGKRVPEFFDVSMRHFVYPMTGPMDKMIAAQRDPRAVMIWQHQLGRQYWRGRTPERTNNPASTSHRDWSIYLGSGGTAAAQYPAKYSFDTTAAPNCTSDFVVYPVNANGSATQPNIVALNQLYSGTGGLCTTSRLPSTASDNADSAEIYWSYNVQGIAGATGGAVTTSPTLSYDGTGNGSGTKIAFVESKAGSAAHFHVLAWKAGDGQSATNLQSVEGAIVTQARGTTGGGYPGTGYKAGDVLTVTQGTNTTATITIKTVNGNGRVSAGANAYALTYSGTAYTTANRVTTTDLTTPGAKGFTINITAVSAGPKTIKAPFATVAPVVGSGTATDLTFGTGTGPLTDTYSWPFPDYNHDTVYVGNDSGQLYRIKDVFCIANSDCTSESSGPAPSIDASWGTGGYVQVCTGKLSAPVQDPVTGNVYVGCADGKLYLITSQGAVSSLQVGTGTAVGGIVDAPLLDVFDGFVYVVSGSGSASGGASGVVVQAKLDLSSSVAVPIGTGDDCNIHTPAPNHQYWTSATSAGAGIYVAGVTGAVPSCTFNSNFTGPALELYSVFLNADGTLRSGTPAGSNSGGGPGYEWAPLLEFYNAATSTDWLFEGTLQNQANVSSINLTTSSANTALQEGMGVTGMVIDNDSSAGQASSFYFGALGENAACNNTTVTTDAGGCAVKLTQAGLQ